MENRLRTGVKGLDQLLGGGLLHHNSVLLKGPPGSGKTTLGLQMLVTGATQFNEPGIMLSFEQFPQQLERDTAAFGWDLNKLAAQNRVTVIFASPDDLTVASSRNENAIVSQISDIAQLTGARRLLVDSVSHLREAGGDGAKLTPRQALLRFLNAVKSLGLTPLLTCELGMGGHDYEDYIADSVIVMHHDRGREGTPDRREIEVVKARGQRHAGGRHPLRITETGIEVFPHMLPADTAPAPGAQPLSSGIPSLDPILGGGFTPGSSVLVAGMAGTFKTTLAAHFLAEGARLGEKGLLISFQEPPNHLVHFLNQRGIDLKPAVDKGDLTVWHRSAQETSVEELLWNAAPLFEGGVKRLVIDSLNDLERAASADQSSPALKLLLAETAGRGVTTLLTHRIERVSGRNPIADIRHVSMVDTIIYVGLAEIESQLEKVISVLKHRGAKADPELRALACGGEGLRVLHGFAGLSGVLEGSPLGRRKAQVEEIFQPLYVMRDFLTLAEDDSLDSDSRTAMLRSVSEETEKLLALLKKQFGELEENK